MTLLMNASLDMNQNYQKCYSFIFKSLTYKVALVIISIYSALHHIPISYPSPGLLTKYSLHIKVTDLTNALVMVSNYT